ncbi:MAG: DUF4468 domain-containing protein [Chitinophagaceae bacterium]|nr:DUF4468 domain-containing protein [Chitinophagaceae bacterium]
MCIFLKKFPSLIGLILCLSSFTETKGQDSLMYDVFPVIDTKINYTRIFEVDSTSKEQLFIKIKDWAVNNYKSQKATLQAEDKEAGYIAYKGYLQIVSTYSAGLLKGSKFYIDIYHTLKFYIKDGKVKIVFTDLEKVSHDFGSKFISDRNNKPIDAVPLESLYDGMKNLSPQKQEKFKASVKELAIELDTHFKNFLTSIMNEISKKGSEFDF